MPKPPKLFAIVALCGLAACSPSAEQRAERNCSNDGMAFVMSQNFVKRQLKAPSTAIFPREGAVTKTGDCSFRVVAYVDAQNSFGTLLRSSYSADMEYLPQSDSWRSSNVMIAE